MKLSILIPSLEHRQKKFLTLRSKLNYQIDGRQVEVLPFINTGTDTIGYYRNELLKSAKGDYVCFIDDDDDISEHYIDIILQSIRSRPTNLSLRGLLTIGGQNPQMFEHSIRYGAYRTTNNWIKYERFPNHLNVIRADIAKSFKFPESNWGEDTDWATQINNSKLLTREVYIEDTLYYYLK